MPENYMQDVVPKSGRSVRNIPVPESRMTRTRRAPVAPPAPPSYDEEPPIEPPKPPRRRVAVPEPEPEDDVPSGGWRSFKKTIITAAVLVIALLGFAASTLFHSATVTAKVKSVQTAIVDDTFIAKKAAGALEMPFELLITKKSGEATVKSTGEEQVDERASGTIVVYNNHNASPQRLIKNTRFEAANGLIYRIDSSVTVPGKKGNTPGSIEVTVYADEPGEKYNVGLTDFTIPGFKGDPRYETFYGRSKTPMTGGFSGVMKVISPEDKAKADDEIMMKVAPEVLADAQAKVPEGYVLYPDAYTVTWTDLPQKSAGGDEVTMGKEATLTAVLFSKKALSSFLAREHVPEYRGDDVLIQNVETLSVAPSKPSTFNPSAESIEFAVSGDALFVWQFDEGALKQDLAGKKSEAIPGVLSNFSASIENITPSFSPFWRKSFPKNVEKIDVERSLE